MTQTNLNASIWDVFSFNKVFAGNKYISQERADIQLSLLEATLMVLTLDILIRWELNDHHSMSQQTSTLLVGKPRQTRKKGSYLQSTDDDRKRIRNVSSICDAFDLIKR